MALKKNSTCAQHLCLGWQGPQNLERNTVVSGNLTSLELSVAKDTSSRGFHLPTEKKNQKGKPGTNKPFCLWQPPHGIWYNPKSKQFITSLLFSASLTYLCLDLLRLSFSLPSSLLWASAHSSVLFAHLSSSHSAHSHYTLNIHICGSISTFFQNFPINSSLLSCAKQDSKILLPCTCSHHTFIHLAATL